MKRYGYIATVLSMSLLLTACGNTAAKAADQDISDNVVNQNVTAEGNTPDNAAAKTENSNYGSTEGAFTGTTIDTSDIFSKRDLSGAYDTSECERITLSDSSCTASSESVMIDGSIITITKEGDYILTGSLSNGMVIVDVDKTEKVQLILNNAEIKSATSAAIYVRQADKVFVTLAGDTQNSLSNGGEFIAIDDNNIDAVIFSKEDLTLNGTGNLTVSSPAGHGIVSKDDLVVTDGNYSITAASHGLAGKDSIAIANGDFAIEAGKDALHSANDDDNTKGWIYISDGQFRLRAESDGLSAVNEIYIAGGNIAVSNSYEGIEARIINIYGGEIDIISSDDGLNATDKRNTSTESSEITGTIESTLDKGVDGKEFRGKGGMMDTQSDANINISGGILHINAEGDGIDSNGYLSVTGGEIYVTGPATSGNGALDYGIAASISGGTVVAAGPSSMAQNFGEASTQCSMLVNTDTQQAGTDIVLFDAKDTQLIAWTTEKSYNSVVISCPELTVGSTYTLKMGTSTTEVTFDSTLYGTGAGGMHGGFGKDGERKHDGTGGKRAERPEMIPSEIPNPNNNNPDGTAPELPNFESDNPDGIPPEMPNLQNGNTDGIPPEMPNFQNGNTEEIPPEISNLQDTEKGAGNV